MPVEIRNLTITIKIKGDKQVAEGTKPGQKKVPSHEKMVEAIEETLKNLKER
ncbi:MAG: hypothetical protein WCK34_01610 [Bacteroidota bacterium]